MMEAYSTQSDAGSRKRDQALKGRRENLGTAYRLQELADNPTKPVTAGDIAQTRRNIRALTKVGDREIHEAVLSCTRARRQLSNSVPIAKLTLH